MQHMLASDHGAAAVPRPSRMPPPSHPAPPSVVLMEEDAPPGFALVYGDADAEHGDRLFAQARQNPADQGKRRLMRRSAMTAGKIRSSEQLSDLLSQFSYHRKAREQAGQAAAAAASPAKNPLQSPKVSRPKAPELSLQDKQELEHRNKGRADFVQQLLLSTLVQHDKNLV